MGVTFSSRQGVYVLVVVVCAATGITVYIGLTAMHHSPWWLGALAVLTLLAWVARAIVDLVVSRQSPLSIALSLFMIAGGAFTTVTASGVMFVIIALGLLRLLTSLSVPPAVGVLASSVAVVGVVVAPLAARDISPAEFVTDLAAVLVIVSIGIARRSRQLAIQQKERLREQENRSRNEAARVALAREIHDVLAHSLGGLIIQLDALDALLEAGNVLDARERVQAAGDLARYGMAEARRAVTALRDDTVGAADTASVPRGEVLASMADLVAAHRALGGVIDEDVVGDARDLPAPMARALQRALQESLSNVRKHALGAPVRVVVNWHTDRVTLTVSNPLGSAQHDSPLARTGTGSGLTGMRERFDTLPRGGSAVAGVVGDSFVVTAEAILQ